MTVMTWPTKAAGRARRFPSKRSAWVKIGAREAKRAALPLEDPLEYGNAHYGRLSPPR